MQLHTSRLTQSRNHLESSPSCLAMFCFVHPADKGHTCERTRNPDGTLTGADRSTAADSEFWDQDDIFRQAYVSNAQRYTYDCSDCLLWRPLAFQIAGRSAALRLLPIMCRRMDFSVACAYAHGTAALRTHLINMTPEQRSLTWPAFSRLRDKWAGKVSSFARRAAAGKFVLRGNMQDAGMDGERPDQTSSASTSLSCIVIQMPVAVRPFMRGRTGSAKTTAAAASR